MTLAEAQVEIVRLKQLIGQLAWCLAAPCQGSPDAVSYLVDRARAEVTGVPLNSLPEPPDEWIAEFERRFRALHPDAVWDGSVWKALPYEAQVGGPQ